MPDDHTIHIWKSDLLPFLAENLIFDEVLNFYDSSTCLMITLTFETQIVFLFWQKTFSLIKFGFHFLFDRKPFLWKFWISFLFHFDTENEYENFYEFKCLFWLCLMITLFTLKITKIAGFKFVQRMNNPNVCFDVAWWSHYLHLNRESYLG